MKITRRRVLMSLLGVTICAISVGVFKIAALGVDPFQSFMSGIDSVSSIDFGTLYVIVNAVLLVFSLLFNRKAIGIATLINLFLYGYITQFTYDTIHRIMPVPSLLVRVLCLAGAIVVICFGSALYMTADLGVSTYDAVAITIAYKWKVGKFKFVRVITDLICVVCGVSLFLSGGGTWKSVPTVAGISTIITAFFMGPLIDFFNVKFARPFLEKENKNLV